MRPVVGFDRERPEEPVGWGTRRGGVAGAKGEASGGDVLPVGHRHRSGGYPLQAG